MLVMEGGPLEHWRSSRFPFAVLLTLSLICAAGCEISDERHAAEDTKLLPSRAHDATALRIIHADEEPANWLTHGRTYSEERFSPLAAIDDTNVNRLGLAWSLDMDTRRGLEATPLVENGILYTTGSWSRVYAVDAANGEMVWSYDPQVPRAWGPKGCCDVVNRGVALWEDKIISASFDGRLFALDKTPESCSGKLIR